MSQHVLSLEVPDTLNDCILRIVDTSIYPNDIPVTCPILLVTLPGFTYSVQFTMSFVPGESSVVINPGFILNLTACDLEIQTALCGTSYNSLPDGIYVIKYSVAPNELVYVEYNHLRITNALRRLQSQYCNIDSPPNCEPPVKVKELYQKIEEIRGYLLAAKAKVETCHQPQYGMDLYNYAIKLLDKLDCKTC